MKLIFVLTVCFLALASYGQDTIYLKKNEDIVELKELAYKYEIILHDKVDTNIVLSKTFFMSGQISSKGYYKPYSKRTKQGKWKEWYETGQIKAEKKYEDGIMNGQLLTYWENGQMKRQDFYEYGELIQGKVWNIKGKKVRYYDYIILPQFKGGMNHLYTYLRNNVRYPTTSKENDIQGRVLVSFVVEKDGEITNIKIEEGVNEELNAEAFRVINNMPDWNAGLIDGEKVRVSFNLPIRFTLRDRKK